MIKHFVKVKTRTITVRDSTGKVDVVSVYPTYDTLGKDIMKKGGKFYCVLDRSTGMWSQNEERVGEIIDEDILVYIHKNFQKDGYGQYRSKDGLAVYPSLIRDSESKQLYEFNRWLNNLPENYNFKQLDQDLTFKSDEVKPEMYRSLRLPYDPVPSDIPCYDKLVGTLYKPDERRKIEWAIGSVLSGESKLIEKMIVIYSHPGQGKGTILNHIIEPLFENYTASFNAEALVSGSDQFATSAFADNPLVALHTDGSLKKIESPTINQIVSHETILINDKGRRRYPIKPNAMLFLATNDFVDFHDTKIGLTRRLIDVYPSGDTLPPTEYRKLKSGLKFELPGIAYHCLEVYKEMGMDAYQGYRPTEMIRKTSLIEGFLGDHLEELASMDQVGLNTLYSQFKTYCEDSGYSFAPKRNVFCEQLKDYFDEFHEFLKVDGKTARNVYKGLKVAKVLGVQQEPAKPEEDGNWIHLKEQNSVIDRLYSDRLAQYDVDGKPEKSWSKCTTHLRDIDTHRMHWLSLPEDVIRIDFDKKNEQGQKDLGENMKAAVTFPPTYCEVSKSGGGLHLYYRYTGNVEELSTLYSDNIEIKKVGGKLRINSDRRMLTLCNDLDVATISAGLPTVEKKKVIDENVITTEQGLRATIKKCLKKEIHPDTTSNVDFIHHILEDAYESGVEYDVQDMWKDVYIFASCSTNQKDHCKEMIKKMHFIGKPNELREASSAPGTIDAEEEADGPIIFYDIEVKPNRLILCWMYDDERMDPICVVDPTPEQIRSFYGLDKLKKPRVGGFNNRNYDDHILYGRMLGDSVYECYQRSNAIINGDGEVSRSAKFMKAYRASYFDVYDFSTQKMSLKKWEIKLGIDHQEFELPWDEPIPDDKLEELCEYCKNDVRATRAVFHKCKADFDTRLALSELSGLPVIDTNRQHITKILLGNDKEADHVYTDLATGVALDINNVPVPLDPNFMNSFPGLEYVLGDDGKYHNMYRGVDLGRGGYVYAEPGMYTNVACLDVGNMHGASILALNKFGRHTKMYHMVRDARMAIKHRDREALKMLFDGKFLPCLDDDALAESTQLALKLILNSTYGIAEATFNNPLKDPRDKCNTIALRGAAMMKTLQDEVVAKGFKVIHIKTDSIKIPNATPEIIDFVIDFGRRYGYEFEHECTYERICLVNDAVYIAKYDEQGVRNKGGKHAGEWTATGTQFQVPYVFKTLFTKEPIIFDDKCETKSCNSSFYLDFDENLPEGEHDYRFVGRVGRFCPIKPGMGGATLYRKQDDKYYAATGSTGYRWLESAVVKALGKEADIDELYYRHLVDEAVAAISSYGDFEWFVNGHKEDRYEYKIA